MLSNVRVTESGTLLTDSGTLLTARAGTFSDRYINCRRSSNLYPTSHEDIPYGRASTCDSGGGRVYGQHAGKTTMSVRTPYYRAGIGALGYPATAGSTSSTDIVDYGNTQCDSYFPDPGCPSASPSPSGTDNWLPQESRTSVIPVQKPLA